MWVTGVQTCALPILMGRPIFLKIMKELDETETGREQCGLVTGWRIWAYGRQSRRPRRLARVGFQDHIWLKNEISDRRGKSEIFCEGKFGPPSWTVRDHHGPPSGFDAQGVAVHTLRAVRCSVKICASVCCPSRPFTSTKKSHPCQAPVPLPTIKKITK